MGKKLEQEPKTALDSLIDMVSYQEYERARQKQTRINESLRDIIEARRTILKIKKFLDSTRIHEHLEDFSREFWGNAGMIEPLGLINEETGLDYVYGYKLNQNFPWVLNRRRFLKTEKIETSANMGLSISFSPKEEGEISMNNTDSIKLVASLDGVGQKEAPEFTKDDSRNLEKPIYVSLETLGVLENGRKIILKRPIEEVSSDIRQLLVSYGKFVKEVGIDARSFLEIGNRRAAELR